MQKSLRSAPFILLVLQLCGAAGLLSAPLRAGQAAQERQIKVALVYSKSGPLQVHGSHTATGFMLGLEYATGGTLLVAGRKLVIVEKDDQGRPELGRSELTAAFAEDKADIAVGSTSSEVALALLPVAKAFQKVLIVEPASSDAITGDKWNKFVFRTGLSSTQEALAIALALDKAGVSIGVLAPDSAFGRDGARAFKGQLQSAKLVHEEFVGVANSDLAASGQRLIDALAAARGRKVVFVWGASGLAVSTVEADFKRAGLELVTGGNMPTAMANYKVPASSEGAANYHYGMPKNPLNSALVAQHYTRFKAPPDSFAAGGFSAAMALVTALQKTAGESKALPLIAAMEGMSFDTPKGKMSFRKEDHQALQTVYHFKTRLDPELGTTPELVREIKAGELRLPIRNRQ
jgi:branched-chain amino acid transport system substrate-binding protein